MSTAATATRARRAARRRRAPACSRNRRWALIASYFFLILFAIFFLMPPYYMVVTALKSDAEMAHMATNPWFIADGVTLDQFRILLEGNRLPDLFQEHRHRDGLRRGDHHGGERPGARSRSAA